MCDECNLEPGKHWLMFYGRICDYCHELYAPRIRRP